MQTDVIAFLNGLRGTQAVVVLCYLLVRRAMSIDELQTFTGVSDEGLRPAIRSLAAKGWLCKQVGEHGRTIWLPAGDSLFGRLIQNPELPDSGALSSSSSHSLSLVSSMQLKQQQEEDPESGTSGLCLKACDVVGIREPKRSMLAKLDHVTPAKIHGHVAQALAGGLSLGTAVYRIEHDWPIEEQFLHAGEKSPNGHDKTCTCQMCKHHRFLVEWNQECELCWKDFDECECGGET